MIRGLPASVVPAGGRMRVFGFSEAVGRTAIGALSVRGLSPMDPFASVQTVARVQAVAAGPWPSRNRHSAHVTGPARA